MLACAKTTDGGDACGDISFMEDLKEALMKKRSLLNQCKSLNPGQCVWGGVCVWVCVFVCSLACVHA